MTIPAPSENEGGPALRSSSLLDKTFTNTRFREGYSTAGVDDFLAAARAVIATYEREGAAATGIALTGDDVVNVRFKVTSLRTGYDQDEVDDYLDLIVATLRHYEGVVTAAG
ncbi:DivIVA domain-containing protein [Conyzicola lurida]|uniref:DivIVA domain-containing protein n=1 Tax=Conyzicola lurida TaxID=1172621 RepID=A0A841AIG2_9MICO|nr:DivIVA domain-containing protein [Conyzicola lurida]